MREDLPAFRDQIRLFSELTLRCDARVLTGDVKQARGNLPQRGLHGVTVLTLQEDLLFPALAAEHNHRDGTRVARVFANHGFRSLDDNNMVFDHVDDAAVPYDLARYNLVGARLIRDGLNLLIRQNMHVVPYAFSSEREE